MNTNVRHRKVVAQNGVEWIWQEDNLQPFDEALVSWNGSRPKSGGFLISISLLVDAWSEFIDYAYWGSNTQHTFENYPQTKFFRTFQDTIELLQGKKATGIKVRVKALNGATLKSLRFVSLCTTLMENHSVQLNSSPLKSIKIKVEGLSQITLEDPRNLRICSPTSTIAVIRSLTNDRNLCPLEFSDHVVDKGFDIYGNWILNTAQASHVLGESWSCYVKRMSHFGEIYSLIEKNLPVIVSVKGPLQDSALPYESGHLIVVTGFDVKTQKVLCMDPAFPTPLETHVGYPYYDFIEAWNRRKGIAYIFHSTFF